jgi:hypothetical protein
MDFDPAHLKGKTKQEIIDEELIEHVVTSEEEMEEKSHRSGTHTDLNLYLLDNKGFSIGSLDEQINRVFESDHFSGHAENFFEEHPCHETVLDDDNEIAHITVATPEKDRVDDCIWIENDGYFWVFTTVPQDWRRNIKNLIKYLPEVERLYLSSDMLEALTNDIRDSYVSGFTAEYHAPYSERQATLQFYGARERDLQKAKDTFDASPTRIEFDQTNSPTAAIQGASCNDGRITFQSVVQGSEDKASETLFGVSEEYQELDKKSFEINHKPNLRDLSNGFAVDGFTAIELTDPDRGLDEGDLLSDIEDEVLNSNQYRYAKRDEDTLRVIDTHHNEIFDLALEPPNIILYARDTTTALSLRSIVQDIFDKLDSTYSLEKKENPIAAQ